MILTDNEKQIIKSFSQSREYDVVRKILLEYIKDMVDTRSLNTNRAHAEIGADIEARNQLYKRIKKFITDLDCLTKEKIKPRINFK